MSISTLEHLPRKKEKTGGGGGKRKFIKSVQAAQQE